MSDHMREDVDDSMLTSSLLQAHIFSNTSTEAARKFREETGTQSTMDKVKDGLTKSADHTAKNATPSGNKGFVQNVMDGGSNAKSNAKPSMLDKAKDAMGIDHNNKV